MTDTQIALYAWRQTSATYTLEDITSFLKKYGKEWEFQEEEGDTGYKHYQGWISLSKKRRLAEFSNLVKKSGDRLPEYFKPAHDNDIKFYCKKHDTRIAGPWSSETKEVYIPRQYRGLLDRLHPFQKHIFDTAQEFDTRIINMIYCPEGGVGKSTIASICELYASGVDLPIVNDAEKLIQSMCDICMARETRTPSPVFVDLPRAMCKERLNGIYTAIEQIKKGKLYDTRYKYTDYWIDSPQIWVFSNIEPDLGLLSRDRWKVWTVNQRKELVKYRA